MLRALAPPLRSWFFIVVWLASSGPREVNQLALVVCEGRLKEQRGQDEVGEDQGERSTNGVGASKHELEAIVGIVLVEGGNLGRDLRSRDVSLRDGWTRRRRDGRQQAVNIRQALSMQH